MEEPDAETLPNSDHSEELGRYSGSMRGLRLDRPPRWGILTLTVLVLANVALFSLMHFAPVQPDRYRPAARTADAVPTAAAAASSAAPSPAPVAQVLAVYGDGYAAGNQLGGLGPKGWPALVAADTGTTLALHAVSRAGYASQGATGQTLLDIVEQEPVPDAAVTVLFGSRNDSGQEAAVIQARATQAIAAVEQQAPQTKVVVIGPAWSNANPPSTLLAARDAVQAAARGAGVLFVDPVKAGWFAQPAGLIASDGVSPTDAGNAYLAKQVEPVVQSALAGTGTRGG